MSHPEGSAIRRVGLYGRVGTGDKLLRLETQMQLLRAHAAAHGWEAHEYSDTASAGDMRRRTAWRRLMEDVRQQRVDAVVVVRLDRVFRSVSMAVSALEEMRRHRVAFIATEEDVDTGSTAGDSTLAILSAVSDVDRQLVARRIRAGMARAKEEGRRFGSPPVTSRPGFAMRWATVKPRLDAGTLSRRQAATELGIGQTTLRRLLEDEEGLADKG